MAKLEIIDGEHRGRSCEFFGGRIVIGRSEECDLQIAETSISRKHAELIEGDEGWVMHDLDSRNGVFFGGERVKKAKLKDGSKIRLGNVSMLFADDMVHEPLKISVSSPKQQELLNDQCKTEVQPEPGSKPSSESVSLSPAPAKPAPVLPVDSETDIAAVKEMAKIYPRIEQEFGHAIVGQRQVLEEIMIAIAADAHCLMVGLPGLAKTLMVSTLSRILTLSFKRIQFTPDLMPSDILGTEVLDVNEATGEKSFRFIKGPVFTNMLLADEINRTPPKTQAALLESMQEKQVTIANETFPLPRPFFVLATQNPLEQEGTYPLPEAQLDRFMFNITVDYPTAEEEEEVVMRTTGQEAGQPRQILAAEDLLKLQRTVRSLPVSPHVVKYATSLARATRPSEPSAPSFIREHIHCGAGPRAAQYLVLGAKARAVVHGRVNVSCEDVRKLALPVMRHRLFTNFTADSEGITPDDLITRLVETLDEPEPKS
jgi:MoxR-like ATPase